MKKIEKIDKYKMVKRDSFAGLFLWGVIFDKVNEIIAVVNELILAKDEGAGDK